MTDSRDEISETMRREMVRELDDLARQGPQAYPPTITMVPVEFAELQMLNRRIGYLEGVLEMLMDGDAETWVRAAREHYRTVYLGLPVVMNSTEVQK